MQVILDFNPIRVAQGILCSIKEKERFIKNRESLKSRIILFRSNKFYFIYFISFHLYIFFYILHFYIRRVTLQQSWFLGGPPFKRKK